MEQVRSRPLIKDRQLLSNSPDRTGRRAVTIPEMLQTIRLAMVNWHSPDLEQVNVGGYSVLYKLAPGLVAKVGLIEPEEAKAQEYFSTLGLALPVIDYGSQVGVGEKVSHDVCSVHGIRPVVENYCSCGHSQAVLLMPEAHPPIGYKEAEILTFMDHVSDLYARLFDATWDYQKRNVAVFQGHLVALDFGNPEREDW